MQKVVGLIFILSMLAMLLFKHLLYWYTRFLLRRSGILTTGTIVRKYQKAKGAKYIVYTFEAAGGREQAIRVWQNTYNKFDEGSQILVRYLPNNPRKSVLVGDNFGVYAMILLGFLAIMVIGGLIFIVRSGS